MSADIEKDKLVKAYYKLKTMCEFRMSLVDDREVFRSVSRKISKAYRECKRIKESDKDSINKYYLLCKELYLELNIAKRKSMEKMVVNKLVRWWE